VLFVFQLWWMLALRFCWPRDAAAFENLDTFLAGNDLTAIDDLGNEEELGQLDALLEVPGGAAKLATSSPFAADRGLARALVDALDPADAVLSVPPVPEPKPDDPLCPRPAPTAAP
jgi:hypothetical protein